MSDETTIKTDIDRLRDLLDRLSTESIRDIVSDLSSSPGPEERPYCWMVGYMQSMARAALREFDRPAVSA